MIKTTFIGAALGCALWGPGAAQNADLVEAARTTLAGIQTNSFVADREYCGMIGRNPAGNIVITRARKGRASSCRPRNFWRNDIEVVASYHTHGSHDPASDAELPSVDDLRADRDEDVLGFVATPGGRFWIIEPQLNRVRMLCGRGCLPSDADYKPADTGAIRSSYTERQLLNREQGLDD